MARRGWEQKCKETNAYIQSMAEGAAREVAYHNCPPVTKDEGP